MTPRLDADAASNNTSQIKSRPANGGVVRAKRSRNIGASHAANGTAPLPKHRVANTPPIVSHTSGIIWRISSAPPLRWDEWHSNGTRLAAELPKIMSDFPHNKTLADEAIGILQRLDS